MSDGQKIADLQLRAGPLDQAAEVGATRVWDKEDSRSLVRLAPEAIRNAMLALPPEYQNLSEPEIRDRFRNHSPTAMDNQVRLSFWLEYERAQATMAPRMQTVMIIRGIMTEDFFYQKYLKNPARVAYLITPPKSYTVRLHETLDFGLDKLREVMDQPIVGKNGKVDTKLAELIFKITTFVDLRKNGAIAQKLQIESKNMNLTGTAREIQSLVENKSMEKLEKKLSELRKKEAMLEKGVHPQAAMIDVVSVTSEPEATDGKGSES